MNSADEECYRNNLEFAQDWLMKNQDQMFVYPLPPKPKSIKLKAFFSSDRKIFWMECKIYENGIPGIYDFACPVGMYMLPIDFQRDVKKNWDTIRNIAIRQAQIIHDKKLNDEVFGGVS